MKALPPTYTTLDLDISLPRDEVIYVPDLGTNSHPHPVSCSLTTVLSDGYKWLDHVQSHLSKIHEPGDWVSWAAYYASTSELSTSTCAKSFMLPIFLESSTSPPMAWHAMGVLKKAIAYLNPGQTPVMVADQPLFTLAKKLQWKYPESELGEKSFLVLLGAMHTEKMLWSVSGDCKLYIYSDSLTLKTCFDTNLMFLYRSGDIQFKVFGAAILKNRA